MLRDRRASPRLDSCPFVYVAVAPDNGGILVNISDSGLALQAVSPLQALQKVRFQFDLPGTEFRISAKGEIVWTDASGELVGSRWLNLPAADKEHIRTWITSQGEPQATFASGPVLVTMEARASDKPGVVLGSAIATEEEREEKRESLKDLSAKADAPDDVGELRSAVLQFKTREEQTPPPSSGIKALGGNLYIHRKVIGAAMLAVLAFAVVGGELIHYGRLGAFAGIRSGIEEFKREASQSESVPRWIARVLVEEPKSETSNPGPEKHSRKVSKRDHARISKKSSKAAVPQPTREEASVASRDLKPVARVPVREESRLAAISAPPGPTASFLVRGNSQLLVIPPARSALDPFGNATPVSSGAGPTVRVFSEFSGRPPDKYEPPTYPEVALQANMQGSVVVQATVNKDGGVKEMNVLSGDPVLAAAVTDVVRGWKYRPLLDNGAPIEADVRIMVTFAIAKN